jgi:prolyl-tRNA synthetase
LLYDQSLKGAQNFCCGANEPDFHYTGFQQERDLGNVEFHDFAKAVEGGICPKCDGRSLAITRGVEVGHIFQLGDKYTRSMDMTYTDESGAAQYPLMGCYGIGVGRLAAAVLEARHDDYGPVWPVSIAPWHAHLCCVKSNDAKVKAYADDIYSRLLAANIEVIYDDRAVSAGVMFSDADLIGAPFRLIVSPRNVDAGCCEIVSRDKQISLKIPATEVVSKIKALILSPAEHGCAE